jgi:FAD-dependent urate hydroxylase
MTACADHDVTIIGAGPYGLAAAAHLREHGLDVHVLGREMEFWAHQMPVGMLLRSSWEASSISDPHGRLSLDAYEDELGAKLSRPVPLDDFVRYGRWFQERAVPDLDRRLVRRVERERAGFRVELEDGDALATRRVIVATGLDRFAHRPAHLAHLDAPMARHASALGALDDYRGRSTVVVGAGQSAIELAALLHEADAVVEVIARGPRVRWLRRSGWLHGRSGPVRRLLYPPTDVGPIGLSWLVAMPDAFRRVPHRLGDRIAYRCIRPAAAGWLVPRVAPVTVTLGRTVTSGVTRGSTLSLSLDDGSRREVDRLVLATGYRVRLDRHGLLHERLLADVRTRDGAPLVGRGFESSVPGLHFVGAFSAASFGPVMKFVAGTPFTGRALAAHLSGRSVTATPPAAEPAAALSGG